MNSSGDTVSAELSLGLVVAEQTIVPLVASLYYSGNDPFAIRMAFHVGTDEPVEWIFARDLLAGGLKSREGIGDVQVWPSSGTIRNLTTEHRARDDAAAGHEILNIAMSSPFGRAHFEAPAEVMSEFLQRTYQIVPAGGESSFIDLEAELDDLLRQG
jgi:hypothetical protein